MWPLITDTFSHSPVIIIIRCCIHEVSLLTIDFPEKDLSVEARAGEDVTAGVELSSVHLYSGFVDSVKNRAYS